MRGGRRRDRRNAISVVALTRASQVAVLTTLVFGGISGSALATIAGVGVITIHAMRRAGYRRSCRGIGSRGLADRSADPPSIMSSSTVQMNGSIAGCSSPASSGPDARRAADGANNVVVAKTGLERMPRPEPPSWQRLWSTFCAACRRC